MENEGENILYQPDNEVKLEVRLEDETVWLNRQQLSVLFDRDIKTIGKHVNNALKFCDNCRRRKNLPSGILQSGYDSINRL